MPHSPAPWYENDGFVMSADGDFVCDPHCNGGPPDHAERDANCWLMTASPELLAKLQTMVAVFNVPDIDPLQAFAAIEQARAAIAKATGSA